MAKFVDRHGDDWEVTITVGVLGRLKSAGINLLEPSWADDLELFGRMVWVLCESQATARKLTEDDFAERFDGPTIGRAVDAIDEEYTVFRLRRPRLIEAAKKQIPAVREAMETAAIERLLAISNNIVGNSPGPSGSIRDR